VSRAFSYSKLVRYSYTHGDAMRMKTLFPSLILATAMLPLAAQQTEAGIQGSLQIGGRQGRL